MDVITHYVGWSFVPVRHGYKVPAGLVSQRSAQRHKPQPGEPLYRTHYNRMYIAVITAYLVYTVVQTEQGLQPNFYNILGVLPGHRLDTRQLRANYLSLSLQYHPDKSQSEDVYMLIRNAYETLKNPTLRAAYDKLGRAALQCTRCRTQRDFAVESMSPFVSFYLITGGLLVLLGILGRLDFGRYWRFAGLSFIAAVEAQLLFGATDPLWFVLPWRTTFERITMLRNLFIVLSIAMSQVGPILFPADTRPLTNYLNELEQITDLQSRQALGCFAESFAPFQDDPRSAGLLQRRMEKTALFNAASEAMANAGPAGMPDQEPEPQQDSADAGSEPHLEPVASPQSAEPASDAAAASQAKTRRRRKPA
ncbi:hypothetical protein BC831DRAFT_459485 [Entophlyctis helioformis]|nr:hypothetical protein BC831DRAFT_459485 [Entophlyctis helioformis]